MKGLMMIALALAAGCVTEVDEPATSETEAALEQVHMQLVKTTIFEGGGPGPSSTAYFTDITQGNCDGPLLGSKKAWTHASACNLIAKDIFNQHNQPNHPTKCFSYWASSGNSWCVQDGEQVLVPACLVVVQAGPRQPGGGC